MSSHGRGHAADSIVRSRRTAVFTQDNLSTADLRVIVSRDIMRTSLVEVGRTVLIGTLVLLAACSSSSSPTPSPDAGSTSHDGSEPVEGDGAATDPTIHTIEATNFAYAPAKLTIKVGDTVKWTFAEGTHTVTSGKNCSADGKFDSKVKTSPSTYTQTFDSEGTFDYFCDYREHCTMGQVGVIDVKP